MKQWPFIILSTVVLTVCINKAWHLVQSELWSSQTDAFLEYWSIETKKDISYTIDQDQWRLVLMGANKAVDYMPGSPLLHMKRALVLNHGVQNGWAIHDSGEWVELRAWETSLLLRPGWPYDWSNYAWARSRRLLIDDKFEQALVLADKLGPWEQQVLENATIFGRYYRGWLHEPVQNILDNSQQRLVKLYPHRARLLERQYVPP